MNEKTELSAYDRIKQLEAENKRLRTALQWWIDVNVGAPNKYDWALKALKG